MIFMVWFFASLLFSFFNSVTMLINQRFKLEGHLISGLRGVGVGIVSLPFLWVVEIPRGGVFWALIMLEAAISTFFNARLYESSSKFGAGATSIISVLSVAFGVALWWAVDVDGFLALLGDAGVFAGVMAALVAVSGGFWLIARSYVVAKNGAMSYMMPAVVALAAMMATRKEIMEHAEFWTAIAVYCAVSIGISGVVNLSVFAVRSGCAKFCEVLGSRRTWKAGALMASASLVTIFCGNWAAFYSPNPAYVSAITLLSPLWIMGIDRLAGRREKAPVWGMIVMLLGLLALVFFGNAPLHT